MKSLIEQTWLSIREYIHDTPIHTSRIVDNDLGCQVYFKCENFQRVGAFKMRGAINAILQLTEDQKSKGVITHSSGNFAQAVALSAQMVGTPAYIVMPHNSPTVKKEAVRYYGGIITECGSNIENRQAVTDRLIKKTGATFIHPSNQIEVIMGNSTIGLEMLNEVPDLDVIFVPVGGGGLIAGISMAVDQMSEKCVTIGAEPKNVDDAFRSLASGKIEKNNGSTSIADGLLTHLGSVNFPIIQKNVQKILRVEEDEIALGMRYVMERLKLVIEPSAGVGIAALIKNVSEFKNKKVGVVLCGGNCDLNKLPWINASK